MAIKIRHMVKGDKPALMKILRDTPEFKPSEVVVAEEVIDSYLYDPGRSGYHTLVAEHGIHSRAGNKLVVKEYAQRLILRGVRGYKKPRSDLSEKICPLAVELQRYFGRIGSLVYADLAISF